MIAIKSSEEEQSAIRFADAIGESTFAFVDGDGSKRASTIEMDLARQVRVISDLVVVLLRSSEQLFDVSTHRGRDQFESTLQGKRFLSALRFDLDEIQTHFYQHSFSAPFCLFCRWTQTDLLRGELFRDVNLREYVLALNAAVRDIRQDGQSAAFNRYVLRSERQARLNYASVKAYTAGLFRFYSKLLVLRIDLGLKRQYVEPREDGGQMLYDDVKACRERFMYDLRRKLPFPCVGYIWKQELALLKGPHIHVMVFLDGQQVREDVTIARLLGEHWRDEVTDSRGVYYSCNQAKWKYFDRLGIGLISYRDGKLRRNLNDAASYLVKSDLYIRMIASSGDRSFGKGSLPKYEAGSRGGRPRAEIADFLTNLASS